MCGVIVGAGDDPEIVAIDQKACAAPIVGGNRLHWVHECRLP